MDTKKIGMEKNKKFAGRECVKIITSYIKQDFEASLDIITFITYKGAFRSYAVVSVAAFNLIYVKKFIYLSFLNM